MTRQTATRLTVPVGSRDHIRGPATAPVTLVEYGDYECPHCGEAHPVVETLEETLGDQLRFVFRHFPLTTVHRHAQLAAEGAEAAGAQGKFWKMHDTLYENQNALAPEDLTNYAADLDLDLDRFVEEIGKHVHAHRVREDFMSGVRSGVNGAPTFFINGMRHEGSWDSDSLAAAIAEELGAEIG